MQPKALFDVLLSKNRLRICCN